MYNSTRLTAFEIFQLLYVDDGAFPFPDRNKLTAGINLIQSHFARFGLEIHIGREGESSKTECVFFPPPQFFNDKDTCGSPPQITKGRADGDPGLSYPVPHLAYAPMCKSQKVPASPKKKPSMTPSQRLPKLTSPLAITFLRTLSSLRRLSNMPHNKAPVTSF